MSTFEETIEATLNADGQIVLSRPTTAPPGPIQVTIRTAASAPSEKPAIRGGVADVIRRIAARQRAAGYPGRTAEEIHAELDEYRQDEEERARMLDAARRPDLRIGE